VINVDQVPVEHDDKMETFLLVCGFLSHMIIIHPFLPSERNVEISVFTFCGFERASPQR